MEIIIKLDRDEPVKVKTSIIYGEMPQFPDMDKIGDKFWTENYTGKVREKISRLEMDLQNRDDEIQELKAKYQKLRERYVQCEMDVYNRDEELHDLKLENDRLKQREEKMLHVIKSIACDYGDCDKCLFFGSDNLPCGDAGDDYKACVNLLNELEEL